MPKAIRRTRTRQTKTLPSAAVRTTIPAAMTSGEAGLDTTGMRRSTNVEVRTPDDNPLQRRINISTRPRRTPPLGTRTGVTVGRQATVQ